LAKLNGKIFDFHDNSEGPMIFVSAIIALMELYDFDEQDFIALWQGKSIIKHPVHRTLKNINSLDDESGFIFQA
jgi:hypothetical protein